MKRNDKVEVSQCFKTSAEKIWQALTNADEMRKWFFENIPAFEPRRGFSTRFPVVSDNKMFTHVWKILEVIPGQKIMYRWSYSEYPGWAKVTFEIEQDGDKCCLYLANEIMEDFPDNIPEFSLESCKGGWEYFIKERLRKYLNS